MQSSYGFSLLRIGGCAVCSRERHECEHHQE
jgi:hypothetical protein